MLSSSDPLPRSPCRILVAGVTGVGKSTLARRIATAFDLPYTEIDGLYHGPNWTPREEFTADVDRVTRGARWVIEWQYREVRQLLVERADTLVWLDYPTRTALLRVVRRTIGRSRSHEVLWNGNVEPPLRSIFGDRDHIIRWAIRTRSNYRVSVPALAKTAPHLQIVRLRSQKTLERWMVGSFEAAVGHPKPTRPD